MTLHEPMNDPQSAELIRAQVNLQPITITQLCQAAPDLFKVSARFFFAELQRPVKLSAAA